MDHLENSVKPSVFTQVLAQCRCVCLISKISAQCDLDRGVEFVDHDAIELIQRFVAHLWSGPRTPAKIYIQESHLPIMSSYAE